MLPLPVDRWCALFVFVIFVFAAKKKRARAPVERVKKILDRNGLRKRLSLMYSQKDWCRALF